ncbi:MAG: hypothetical protein PHI59_07560, partial [Candidatus Omnitrophica bacterium]|nr:hypothetical protein [Candidatus Omnitrophota bacterium]
PHAIMAKHFPAMTMSILETNFADRELLFHLLLFGIRKTEAFFGDSGLPPFHLPAFVFLLTVLSAFIWSARRLGGRDIIIFSLLLITISPLFSVRILTLRPYTFAIALMLIATGALLKIKTSRQIWQAIVLGIVFAWSYSNPHFVLVPAIAAAAIQVSKRNYRTAVYLPLAALAGILIGYIIHPQFPNTFIIWKMQCIDVVRQVFIKNSPLILGTEAYAPSNSEWPYIFGVILLFLINCCTALWLILYKGRKPSRQTIAIISMSFAALVIFFFTIRAIEYACPLTVLASVLLWGDVKRVVSAQGRKLLLCIGIFVLIVSILVTVPIIKRDLKAWEKAPFLDFAGWAKKSDLKVGTIIGNVNWSDFPQLFFAVPQFRYLTGQDPTFAYNRFPERTIALERFRTGEQLLPPEELEKVVGTRIIFVSKYMPQLSKDMYDMGYRIAYQGIDGWVFYIGK